MHIRIPRGVDVPNFSCNVPETSCFPENFQSLSIPDKISELSSSPETGIVRVVTPVLVKRRIEAQTEMQK